MKLFFNTLRLYFFWLLYFAIFRAFFILSNYNLLNSGFRSILDIFIFGIRLDLSTASYCILIPFVLMLTNSFYEHRVFKKIYRWYHYIIIFLLNLVCVINITLFKSWHTLINKHAVEFINDPALIFASMSTGQIIFQVALLIVLFFAFVKLFHLTVPQKLPAHGNVVLKLITSCVTLFVIFFLGRGGLQLIPINESSCYFSGHIEDNQAAVNPAWYLVRNIQLSGSEGDGRFVFFNEATARQKFDSLFNVEADSTIQLLKTPKPNIVILLLESYTTDLIQTLDGDLGNSPNIDKIISCDAFTFTQCYASGFRTDQMLPSVFSGFPAQPGNSVIRNSDKIAKLPYLPVLFKNQGYHTSFYYGGEMGFANMKTFLTFSGFEKTVDNSTYASDELNSKWGAHDEFTLKKLLHDLSQSPQPFFTSFLTISLHEPFEIPVQPKFAGSADAEKFKSAAYYTDSCLGVFFAEAQKQSWYANTLFILVADHGHHLPRERSYFDPYTHRIPLIFTGGALKDELRGKKFDKVTAQNDIPAILCRQFNLDASSFAFSKNTLNNYSRDFAYLCFDDGFTWITGSCSLHYSQTQNNVTAAGKCTENEEEKNKSIQNGKAFLQLLYEKFLKL